MPKLGDIKLDVVYAEDKDKKVTTSDHPIENGLKIVDHVQKEPVVLKLSGVCTGSDATTRITKLEGYMDQGKRLTYVGRYSLKDALIESISSTKDVEVSGSEIKFEINLKQTAIVKTAKYAPGTKPPTSLRWQTTTQTGRPGKTCILYG
jgi:hypothetical protein